MSYIYYLRYIYYICYTRYILTSMIQKIMTFFKIITFILLVCFVYVILGSMFYSVVITQSKQLYDISTTEIIEKNNKIYETINHISSFYQINSNNIQIHYSNTINESFSFYNYVSSKYIIIVPISFLQIADSLHLNDSINLNKIDFYKYDLAAHVYQFKIMN